jgi:hypothetical protein
MNFFTADSQILIKFTTRNYLLSAELAHSNSCKLQNQAL